MTNQDDKCEGASSSRHRGELEYMEARVTVGRKARMPMDHVSSDGQHSTVTTAESKIGLEMLEPKHEGVYLVSQNRISRSGDLDDTGDLSFLVTTIGSQRFSSLASLRLGKRFILLDP